MREPDVASVTNTSGTRPVWEVTARLPVPPPWSTTVIPLMPNPGAIRRPARHLVHATAAVVGVSLALGRRFRIV
jgi:hypothetical protein